MMYISLYVDEPNCLGYIDDTLVFRYLMTDDVTDLYINHGGLYFLPYNITIEGFVDSVCAFGYTNVEYENLLLNENRTDINRDTRVRPFVYVMVYRPLTPTIFQMISKPAIVYHAASADCTSRNDGLDWQVQMGDKIGVFIPDGCTSVDELSAEDCFHPDFGEVALLCPSQVNIAVDGDDYAHYLNVSFLELAEIRTEQFIAEQTLLNIQVAITENSKLL